MGKFALFDCDDTLVGSERLAFKACCGCVNRLLVRKGVPKQFTQQELMEMYVGRSFRYMCQQLSKEYGFCLTDEELEPLVLEEQEAVIEVLKSEVQGTPGIRELLEILRDQGYVLAVVSSSALRRVQVCLEAAGLAEFFADRVFSAQSLNPPTSKPDPAVYLHALRVLGIGPNDSVFTFEDSTSGVLSAKRAGIAVVGYLGAVSEQDQGKRTTVLFDAGACAVVRSWKGFQDFACKKTA